MKYATIPSDAVDIAERDYHALFLAQSKGASIVPGPDGTPRAISRADGEEIDLSTVTEDSDFRAVHSVRDEARIALAHARKYVYDHFSILNDPTPDAWVAYLKALMAIENGADTVSTELPAAPQ
ncbi:hypothetical protein AAC691_15590 [Nguyenibacter vanlangensis]|uniref:Tail assembly chaperone n=1 Tax=Nguyenibacter vanlangensis TaxID=1216886 RepID=A0ABZ3D1R9_9PROT